jgi:hypothetical protein
MLNNACSQNTATMKTLTIVLGITIVALLLIIFFIAHSHEVNGEFEFHVPEPELTPMHIPVPVPEPEPEPVPRDPDYFDNIAKTNHDNDSQNVHNSYVVQDIKRKYDRLLELNNRSITMPPNLEMAADTWRTSVIESTFREIAAYVSKTYPQDTVERITPVLAKARNGYKISALNASEDWVLAQVWIRIHSSDNDNVRQQLLSALIDQMKDASKLTRLRENDIIAHGIALFFDIPQMPAVDTECITGRISRYFQTFTLLDTDTELQQPIKDKKELENEAYAKSSKILTTHLKLNPALAELYSTVDPPTDKLQDVENFKTTIKTDIQQQLTNDYKSILLPQDLDKLIETCLAGV